MRLAAVLILLAGVARAEPQPAVAELMHYMAPVTACFDAAEVPEEARACVTAQSSLCMDTEEAGYSTVGMMFCTLAEYEAWDRLLNREYQATMDGLRRMDEEEAEFFPEYANRAESLRAAQRAWIPFRDAECALAYAMWGAGSMRQIAGASCLLDMTAERTIEIRFLGEQMR